MTSTPRLAQLALAPMAVLALLALAGVQPARAQAAPPAPAAAAKAASAAAAPAPGARDEVVVIEDDGVRIEETRVGGTVKRVTVQSKVGNVRAYEIQVAPAGRDPSQERGNAGRRAWSLFSF
jgi:hypothetical protein